jgi:hypothetical protein
MAAAPSCVISGEVTPDVRGGGVSVEATDAVAAIRGGEPSPKSNSAVLLSNRILFDVNVCAYVSVFPTAKGGGIV